MIGELFKRLVGNRQTKENKPSREVPVTCSCGGILNQDWTCIADYHTGKSAGAIVVLTCPRCNFTQQIDLRH